MPKYRYVARSAEGQVVKGTLKASSPSVARTDLAQRDLTVTSLVLQTSVLQLEVKKSKIKSNDLLQMTRQLAAFIRAGIPILDAIAELADEGGSRAVKRVMLEIGDDLRAGATLSAAVAKHPNDFPNYYRGILQSVELTGELDVVLDQLAEYIDRDQEARRKIKGAMTYPLVIAAMSLITIVVLVVFVLPKFKIFFASLNAQLPLPTRILLGIVDFLEQWWWLIVILLVLLVIFYLIVLRVRRLRKMRDAMALRLPIVGETIRYAIIERFTRLLASMVAAGIALPEAMGVAGQALDNLKFQDALAQACDQMVAGAGVSGPIADTKLFPPMAAQMIRVGESTGTLDAQLGVAAKFYERELDYKIKRLTTLIEPIVITVMGVIVGFVAIALVSAMYGIFRAANLG